MSHNVTVASNDIWHQWGGKIVHKGVLPGYVVLSFIISYIGSWTTLELINRRTSSKGLYNWSLLGGAAVAMGGIGIWSMHFVGNRALVLGDGSVELQISYNGLLTGVSFFLPIIVLFMAFAAVGADDRVNFVRLGLGGTLTGLGVASMHFLGQAAVTNYDCIYYVAFVIGAVIIAITAGTAALGIFFVFRAAWSAAWWKRGICASILAGAVSGMHWVAFSGTKYRLREDASFESNNSRNATTIAVVILSIGGSSILFVSAFFAQAAKIASANRARQMTLAAAVFDQDGKILVKSDGLLPLRKITSEYRETNFNDHFGISHPAYLWMYRASRNWAGISTIIPAMTENLHRSGLRRRIGAEHDDDFEGDDSTQDTDYSIIFRQLFCAAAAELADDMNHPVDKLGNLYDDIIPTGKKKLQGKKDLENLVQDSVGKGQILFLVREVDQAGGQQLLRAGFRFAQKKTVLSLTSGVLKLDEKDLERHLEIMHDDAVEPPFLDPGCHLAVFAIRASMAVGFDVLIRQDARNLIPTMQLPFDALESWQEDYLKSMDSQTIAVTMKTLNKASRAKATPPNEQKFAAQLLHSLEAFKDELDDPFFNDAMLVATPVHSACRGITDQSQPGFCTIIAFRAIIPIGSRAPGKKLDFTPLTFLKERQRVYLNSPDHDIFARRVYREFAPVFHLSPPKSIDYSGGKDQSELDAECSKMTQTTPPASSVDKASQEKHGFFGPFGRKGRKDNTSEMNLIDEHREEQGVEMTEQGKEPPTGVTKGVSKDNEQPSFVDELFDITIRTRTVK